jgi:hypothetical protein
LGAFKDLDTLLEKYGIGSLLISFNHKDPEQLLMLKRFCKLNNLHLKQFSINLTDIDIEI